MADIQEQDKQTIVPTLVIGIGGTGLEVITRIRRLIVESYGSLDNLPVVGFLHIDTDQNYKIKTPEMAGPSLEDYEKFWATVSYDNAKKIKDNPETHSWYHNWLPSELTPKQLVSEEGAGQIRACGRFSFFYNYQEIYKKCDQARQRISVGRDRLEIDNDVLKIEPKLNIFVVGSISGGTGSGMLIDLGYSLRNWFQGERLELTAIIPTPDAFSGIAGKIKTQENGYAALMELNYFSDAKTEYSVKYSLSESSRITDARPPYDYLYLTGTRNQLVTLELETIQEMMAQQIFLDLVSDYSPHKRSVRDNIKREIEASVDQARNPKNEPIGRSYPINFFSFGIATIEIPVHAIRKTLSAQLTADLYDWWLNANIQLPSDLQQEAEDELKEMKLSSKELLNEILLAPDGLRYEAVIQKWIKQLENEIIAEKQLECTAQLPNPFAKETGKILGFVDSYLKAKVDDYRLDHLRNDRRRQGDFIQRMNNNARELTLNIEKIFQEKIYTYLEDTSKGSRAIKAMLAQMRNILETQIEKLEREADKTWKVGEKIGLDKYNTACSQIDEFRSRWMARKENWMKEQCDEALAGIGRSFQATLQCQSRLIAVKIQRDFLDVIDRFQIELDRWSGRMQGSESKYRELANQQKNYLEQLEFVGLKLFKRHELEELYNDFLTVNEGKNVLFKELTQKVKTESNRSQFWNQSSYSQIEFRLLDVAKIDDLKYPEFEGVVEKSTRRAIKEAPAHSKLYTEMDACTRFMRLYPETQAQERELQLLFERSKPLIRLDTTIPQEGGFDYIQFHQVGIVGGENTSETAAQQQIILLKKYFVQQKAIAPLTSRERHKILATHEIAGFSLRCIAGSDKLRNAYQKWRGERIQAERAILKGLKQENELPPPVHIQKDMVFWDFHPSARGIEQLVLVARAFGILRQEVNQKTKKEMICYRISTNLGEEKVAMAANWEDAVQILELPDCREDKQQVERKLNELLENAETDAQKQQLVQQLQEFLSEQLTREFRNNEDEPLYRRQRTIIQDFITKHKLGTISQSSPPSQTPSQSQSQPHSEFGFNVEPKDKIPQTPTNSRENTSLRYCTKCGRPISLSDNFCSNCGSQVS